ncbi:MAG: proteasome accessory factor PafA2, partial [Micrococcales bacterium]
FRGECVRRYGANINAASWDSVVFDLPGERTLKRVPMMEPTRGSRAHVGELLDASASAAELVATLAAKA